MFQNLDVFKISHAMARHAGTRQAVVARNIANADTPGYKARDIQPFQDIVSKAPTGAHLRGTRPGHLGSSDRLAVLEIDKRRAEHGDPNGNSVSLEQELLKGVEVKRQHDRAVAIYKSSMTIVRAALGRR